MNFTLRQLEYALAVAKHQSFSEAARQCFVSQPSLSAQIAQLETVLGAKLFERGPKGVQTTAFGVEFTRRAGSVLAGLEDLEALSRGQRQPLTGDLRLGVIPTVAPYCVPNIVELVQRKNRACRLLLAEDQTQRLVARLEAGELDLLLLALEASLGAAETLPLGRDDFLAAVDAEHRLAKQEKISLAELREENFLLLEDGHCLSEQVRTVCGGPGGELGDFRAGSLATLAQMVALGHGVTLIPRMAQADLCAALPAIVTRPLSSPAYRTIGLAWRRRSPRAKEFALFGEWIAGHFAV